MKPYFETDRGKLYHGNAVDIMPELEPVDLVVTSPPYDNLRKYEGYDFPFPEIALGLEKLLSEGAVLVWIVGDQTIDGNETGSSFRLVVYFNDV